MLAVIQAIDQAKKRMQEAAGAGIKVANSQHGGGAAISNMDSGAGEVAEAGKLASIRQYGAGVGKGFANAGAVATGNKAAEWGNIDNGVAKKAAEDIVKGWRKKDFKTDSTNTVDSE